MQKRTTPYQFWNHSWLFLSALLLFAFSGIATAQTSITPTGDGATTATAYQITNLGNLVWLADNVGSSSGKFYALANDIDTTATAGVSYNTGLGFAPIGNNSVPFQGIFLGNGYTIANLTIKRSSQDYVGLFAHVGNTGIVQNMHLANVSIQGNTNVGGLVGYAASGRVIGCSVSGIVVGAGNYIGGLIGYADGSTSISESFTTCNVTSNAYTAGGLVGRSAGATVSRCFATGNVTAVKWYAGGLVGYGYPVYISECFATGKATGGNHYTGGLVGYVNSSSVAYSFATGDVVGNNEVGGLVGEGTDSSITQCFAAGYVSGGSSVNGLVGNGTRVVLTNCYWDINQTGCSYAMNGATVSGATGATTADMLEQSTYVNWDFPDTWGITSPGMCSPGNYPHLRTLDVLIASFHINDGASTTTSRLVNLQAVAGLNPTHYMVSESPTFADANWQTYDAEADMTFTLSAGNGSKKVYFKVCNDNDTDDLGDDVESSVVCTSITLNAPTASFVKNSVLVQSAHSEAYNAKTAAITSTDRYALKANVQLPSSFNLESITASTACTIQIGNVTFSDILQNAASRSLRGSKGGSAVFRVKSGTKTTLVVTLTWTAKKVLTVVVTGTPTPGTGSAVTTNILNALAAEDGSVAANAPLSVGLGNDSASNTTGVVCTGTRTTKAVKNTSINLNSWVMSGKK